MLPLEIYRQSPVKHQPINHKSICLFDNQTNQMFVIINTMELSSEQKRLTISGTYQGEPSTPLGLLTNYDRTALCFSNAELVCYSDPHCSFNSI